VTNHCHFVALGIYSFPLHDSCVSLYDVTSSFEVLSPVGTTGTSFVPV
jgi:hypothetical protein